MRSGGGRGARRWAAAPAWALLGALVSCGGLEEPRQQTEILWDTWGVPHIYAPDGARLHRAFGWAQMESHGDLVLRLYGQARGRAAEYWGPTYAEGDRFLRTMGVPGRAPQWYAAQEAEERAHLDAFAAGMNAYAEAHRERLSDEMEVVLPVTGVDVLSHVQRVFHLTFIAGDGVTALKQWMAASPGPPAPPAARGSNAWALGPRKATGEHAMLLANPHLPWSGMSLFYEAQVACPGVNASGATLVGMPVLAIAFTDYLGWTHTVNTFDGVDLYELTTSDSGYAWDGGGQPFESRCPSTGRCCGPTT